jgi:hypothetical protein
MIDVLGFEDDLNKIPLRDDDGFQEDKFEKLIDLIVDSEIRVIITMTPISQYYWRIFDELYDRGLRGKDFVFFIFGASTSFSDLISTPDLLEKRANFIDRTLYLSQVSLVGETGENYIQSYRK